MADISMLTGDMYLRNAWRFILQNDINLNAELQEIKDRVQGYMYYINPQQFMINTVPSSIIKFNPEVITSTHVILGFTLNVYSSSSIDLNLQIKYDGTTVFSPIQTLVVGNNIIGFPHFIPSVGTGIHQLEIIAYTSSGSIIISPNGFNIHLQAQSISGASSLPPSINILEEILYIPINDNSVACDSQVNLLTDVGDSLTQTISSLAINNNSISTSVVIQLS